MHDEWNVCGAGRVMLCMSLSYSFLFYVVTYDIYKYLHGAEKKIMKNICFTIKLSNWLMCHVCRVIHWWKNGQIRRAGVELGWCRTRLVDSATEFNSFFFSFFPSNIISSSIQDLGCRKCTNLHINLSCFSPTVLFVYLFCCL